MTARSWRARRAIALYVGIVTPRDLFELAERAKEVFERVETGKAFAKVRRRK